MFDLCGEDIFIILYVAYIMLLGMALEVGKKFVEYFFKFVFKDKKFKFYFEKP